MEEWKENTVFMLRDLLENLEFSTTHEEARNIALSVEEELDQAEENELVTFQLRSGKRQRSLQLLKEKYNNHVGHQALMEIPWDANS
jgi:hypothetical protein